MKQICAAMRRHGARRSVPLLVAVALGAAWPFPLAAQGVTDPVTQSVREPTDFMLDQVGAVGLQPGELSFHALLVPNFSATNGLSTYGATVGVKLAGLPRSMLLQVRGMGHVLDRSARNQHRFGADMRLSGSVSSRLGAAIKATVVRTPDVSTRAEAEAAADFRLLGNFHTLKAGVSARYRSNSPSNGGAMTGGIVATGLMWRLGAETELQAAYEFKNRFANEDGYSITFAQRLPQLPVPTVLIVTGGKHRFIGINLAITFPL